MLALTPFLDRVGNSQAPEGSQRNVSIAKMKKGKNDDVLFSAPGYNTIGDTYQGNQSSEIKILIN